MYTVNSSRICAGKVHMYKRLPKRVKLKEIVEFCLRVRVCHSRRTHRKK